MKLQENTQVSPIRRAYLNYWTIYVSEPSLFMNCQDLSQKYTPTFNLQNHVSNTNHLINFINMPPCFDYSRKMYAQSQRASAIKI
jgi:hypothetical protein